ncbi:MAG: hypothetical protein DSZ21_00545 [Tenericutes bacterium]|nr:MAG: hypothetical protein DSZ21_00545 [Mycoplasmatota bacterium]
MKRKEIFEKLKKDIEPKVDYNYKKTTKGVSIMKRTNEATEKQMLKELLSGFGQLVNRFDNLEKRFDKLEERFDQFEKNQLEFNKSIMQRLDNIVTKNNLSE